MTMARQPVRERRTGNACTNDESSHEGNVESGRGSALMRHAKSIDRSRHGVGPTAWARIVSLFARRAERIGVPRTPLLARVGLTERDLADPDGRIALETLYALLEAIVEHIGDPLALLGLARDMETDSLDALAFVVLTSPTLRAGLDAFIRYQRIFADGDRYDIEADETWVKIVYTPWGSPRLAHRLMAEMFAVDLVNNASALTGVPFDRPRVRFAHAAPDDVRRHATLLGVDAEFNAARNEVSLRATDLERRVAPEGQEAVCAYFHRDLDARLRALPPDSIAGTIRDALLRAPTLDATMAGVARQLHMSARTLQRRLKEEGTSLRALLEQVRRARAGPLLESGQSIAEVAYLLGYAEPSAFHHAFRRWTSETPEAFRTRVRKGRNSPAR